MLVLVLTCTDTVLEIADIVVVTGIVDVAGVN